MEARPAISSGLFDVAACSAVSSDAFDVEARSAVSSGVFDVEARSAVSSHVFDVEVQSAISSVVFDVEARSAVSVGATDELGGCITGPSMRPSAWPSIKIQIVISVFGTTKDQDTSRV